MYGQGTGVLGSNVTGATGLTSTVAGIAVLPNTGGNIALHILTYAIIGAGILTMVSFTLTRVVAFRNR